MDHELQTLNVKIFSIENKIKNKKIITKQGKRIWCEIKETEREMNYLIGSRRRDGNRRRFLRRGFDLGDSIFENAKLMFEVIRKPITLNQQVLQNGLGKYSIY